MTYIEGSSKIGGMEHIHFIYIQHYCEGSHVLSAFMVSFDDDIVPCHVI